MTQPSSPSQEPVAKSGSKGFKVTLLQGVIGAITLAGTTAIPIVVKQVLETRPVVSPATIAPAQVTPSSAPVGLDEATVAPSADATAKRDGSELKGKDRKAKD